VNRLLFAVGVLLSSFALAHAYLARATPAAGQTISVLPKTVTLEFTEPLEMAFSTFRVYPLPMKAGDTDVKAAAQKLVEVMLTRKDDEALRADAGLVSTSSPATKLELKLKDTLSGGWYVVMWKALSVDTHVTTDHYAFRYQPR
jgi:copper resistance protein C